MATVYSTEVTQETKRALDYFLGTPVNSLKRNVAFLEYAKLCDKEHKSPVSVYYRLKGKPKTH